MYLSKSKEALELGIVFNPPKSDTEGSDIEAIVNYKTQIDNANARLLKRCEKGPYWAPVPDWDHRHTVPKGCLEYTQKWHAVFSGARGKVANNMASKASLDIQKMKRMIAEKKELMR